VGKFTATLGVCILLIVSVSHVTAETLAPEVHAVSNMSNVNFTSAPFTTGPSNDSSKCDFTSYPDFCIAPPPPSLNCDDVNGNDFKVFPPDPHGFDRDHDGEGCETSE
jgi:hypothetical protein